MQKLTLFCTLVIAMPLLAKKQGNSELSHAVRSSNAFNFSLFSQLPKKNNLIYSPYSISTLLTLAQLGARGQTALEMAKALFISDNPNAVKSGTGQLIAALNGKGYQLHTANALWLQSGFHFETEYLNTGKNAFHSELREVDFKSKDTLKTINQWVSDQTHWKIKDILNDLDPQSQLVLSNAVYFKGKWEEPFNPAATDKLKFFTEGTKHVLVDMMHHKTEYRHGKTDGVTLLELPYRESSLAMLILMPEKRDGLVGLESGMTKKMFTQWTTHLHAGDVSLRMPKFHLETEFNLKKPLNHLGMASCFTPNADFSGMAKANNLFISEVAHKAYIDVSEAGTEAAAATVGALRKSDKSPGPVTEITIDHPFLFAIRDKANGAILFMGRVVDPTK